MRHLAISTLLIVLIFIVILMTSRKEHFDNPKESTTSEIGEGASELYGWGFGGIKDEHQKKHKKQKCPRCDHQYISDHTCNIVIDERHACTYCDITKNKDIDKYVLKSSIPPCPDMSQYAKKSMVQACPNMNDYMLKSKLPEYCAAYRPDKDKYMLKTQCQPEEKYKVVYKDITKHPDYDKYMSKENCKKYKTSWIQDFEDWWDSVFGGDGKRRPKGGRFPAGYSYSPYAGYGTDNVGYALDGGKVRERHLGQKEGL